MASSEENQVIACHTLEQWKKQFDKCLLSKQLMVVDFTALWCGPCRVIAPIFSDLAKSFPRVIFLKVDVDELKSVAEEYKINAMPTFVFLKEGKEVKRTEGASKEILLKFIMTLDAAITS